MTVNKPAGDSRRKGAVKNRIQVFNPKTKLWVKINTDRNRIIDVKTSGSKFKGVLKLTPKK
jgi:hypothetical protein